MNSIFAIAGSGLQAAQLRLAATAHNIANIGTADFAPQRVETSGRADGGVDAVVTTGAPGGEDLVADLIELKSAEYAFRANAVVLARADTLLGILVDERA